MMGRSALLLLFLFFLGFIKAQVPFLEPCPNVEAMSNFELKKYLGKWYEAERYFAIFEFAGKCVTANYALNDNGTVNVLNQLISAITGLPSSIEGTGSVAGRPDEGKLSVRFPSSPVDAPYWILDTDYDNYAVVWSCNDFGIFSTRNAWILTRSKNPSLDTTEKAYSALDKVGINRAYLIRTDQTNCPEVY